MTVASRKPKRGKILWGNLFFALPLGYVFYDPIKQQASLLEWVITALTFFTVMALFLFGISNIEVARVARKVCAAIFLIAIASVAYRPSGAIYFAMTGVFVPFAVGPNVRLSALLIAGIASFLGIEWWLVYRNNPAANIWVLFAFGLETLLIGGGMIGYAQQHLATRRLHKVAERERIARDLHDVLGQTLSSIALKAELARRLFHADATRAVTEIEDVERIARAALDEVREAIHGYHSGDIYSELERVGSMLEAAGIAVERHCDNLEIPPAYERVLALVLREAVTNIVRHSQAKTCRLALACVNQEYRLEVSDDGRGGTHQEGIGMRSIRTRIEAVGGRALWVGVTGTQLIATLPLPSEAGQT